MFNTRLASRPLSETFQRGANREAPRERMTSSVLLRGRFFHHSITATFTFWLVLGVLGRTGNGFRDFYCTNIDTRGLLATFELERQEYQGFYNTFTILNPLSASFRPALVWSST